jgi:hypothetical protein
LPTCTTQWQAIPTSPEEIASSRKNIGLRNDTSEEMPYLEKALTIPLPLLKVVR